MKCPSDKCGSSNVQHLPHYWLSLPPESPLKRKYAQPAEGDRRARLVAAVIAAAGLVLVCTGSVGVGLAVLAAGGVAAWVLHGRIVQADGARDAWTRRQICLACTHLWVPK